MNRDSSCFDLDLQDRAALSTAVMSLQGGPGPGERRLFADLESWVAGFFTRTFGRPGWRWCRRWWDHPEAVVRLAVLWATWEQAEAGDPRATTDWLRGCLDPNITVLFSDAGPFSACTADGHCRSPEPRSDGAPAGWWPQGWWDLTGTEPPDYGRRP